MKGFTSRGLPLLFVVGAVLGGAAGAAYATSALTSVSTTTINACRGPFGLLRVVNEPSDCRHSEQAISWNVQGPKGDTGPVGPKGDKGDTGLQGTKGDTGAAGPMGVDGPMGPIGPAGPAGLPGLDGSQGPAGPAGPAGAQGPAGPQGQKGDTGATGPQGPTGPAGAIAGLGTNTGNAIAANGAACVVGQILLSASPSRTVGGVPANGQLLLISQDTALFSLLGVTYGGDGKTTFALPDLRALTPNNMTYSICENGIFPTTN